MKRRRNITSRNSRLGRAFLMAAAGSFFILAQVLPRTDAQNMTSTPIVPSPNSSIGSEEGSGENFTTATPPSSPLDPPAGATTAPSVNNTVSNATQPPPTSLATTPVSVASPSTIASASTVGPTTSPVLPSPSNPMTVSEPAPTVVTESTQSPVSWEVSCGGLECLHNSTCQPGNATYNIDTDVGFHTVTNQNGYHCACPAGFGGLDCSRPYQDCSASAVPAQCYHGGTCLPPGEVEDTGNAAFCECSEALFNGQRYAGKYCEVAVEESEYCPDHKGLFCLNGGSCPTGGPRAPRICTCRDGYFGEHCEFITPHGPECTLECFNEGVCRVGRVNAPWGNRDDFYCDCPRGYGGIQCEHLSETCGDGQTVCLHGATCESSVSTDGSVSFSCACPDPYLGGSGCNEKRRMELCNPQLGPEYSQSMAVPAFCLNGGTCRDVMNGNLVDFACDCPPLFHGPHCEFLKTAEDIGDIDQLINPQGSGRSAGLVAGSVALVTLALVSSFFVIRQVRRVRRSRKREQDVILNLQSFREENFGAISANGSMLFPGVSPPPSTVPETNSSSFATGELLHDIDIS